MQLLQVAASVKSLIYLSQYLRHAYKKFWDVVPTSKYGRCLDYGVQCFRTFILFLVPPLIPSLNPQTVHSILASLFACLSTEPYKPVGKQTSEFDCQCCHQHLLIIN